MENNIRRDKPTKQKQSTGHIKDDDALTGFEKDTQKELINAKNFFPFDLFTDTIVVFPNKVSIFKNIFFLSGYVRTIATKDIGEVIAELGPFFGTIKIHGNIHGLQTTLSISYLKKADAVKIRNLIEDLITSNKKDTKG